MQISILQLNMNSDNYWERLIPFLKSKNFDIMQFQEVTGKDTVTGNLNSKIDVFQSLKNVFGSKYDSELAVAQRYESGTDAYLGNATFFKKEFRLTEKDIFFINKNEGLFPAVINTKGTEGRVLLNLKLEKDGREISFLNTHLSVAETSEEHPHQTAQGEEFLSYLKTVRSPFVLTGDFNLSPGQPLIQKINRLGRNLTSEYKVENTLNPRTHRARHLFPPGTAVDYIYVSSDVKVLDFKILEEEDISDHLGLAAVVEA